MKKNKFNNKKSKESCSCNSNSCSLGAIYGLGFIGSLIYNLSISSGFLNTILAILKSFVWPAFLVYELFKFLGI